MASNTDFYIKGIFILVIAGGGLLYSGWKRRARARLIEDTPKSKLASAPQGLVEVEGFAWPSGDKSLQSVNGYEVVYYEFALQRQESKGSGKNRRTEWVTVFSRKHDELFYICDPTGLAMVDPRSAEIELKDQVKTNWKSLPPDKRNRVFQLLGLSKPDDFPPSEGFFSLFAKPYRILEREIRVGSPLYVTGDMSSLSDPPLKIQEPGLSRFAGQMMDAGTRELKNVDRLLDKNGDSQVSSDEARDGYAAAAQLARSKARIEPTEEKGFELWGMIQQSMNHKLFIADDHESRLVKKLKRFIWIQIGSGVTCLTAAICVVLGSFMPTHDLLALPNTSRLSPVKITRTAKPIEDQSARVNRLHVSCLTHHSGASCEELLTSSEKYALSDQYQKYYRDEACREGITNYCDPRDPASKP